MTVKEFSPEIIYLNSEADGVRVPEGSTLVSVIGEDRRTRRGLRPLHDTTRS